MARNNVTFSGQQIKALTSLGLKIMLWDSLPHIPDTLIAQAVSFLHRPWVQCIVFETSYYSPDYFNTPCGKSHGVVYATGGCRQRLPGGLAIASQNLGQYCTILVKILVASSKAYLKLGNTTGLIR